MKGTEVLEFSRGENPPKNPEKRKMKGRIWNIKIQLIRENPSRTGIEMTLLWILNKLNLKNLRRGTFLSFSREGRSTVFMYVKEWGGGERKVYYDDLLCITHIVCRIEQDWIIKSRSRIFCLESWLLLVEEAQVGNDLRL